MSETPTLTVVGSGAVGSLMVRQLRNAPGHRVVDVDCRPSTSTTVVGDVTDPHEDLRRLLAASDVVVVALPEDVAARAAEPLARLVRCDAAIVDTLSVKSPWFDALDAAGPRAGTIVGLNPLFAPDLGFAGRPVAFVDRRPGPWSDWMRDRLSDWSAQVVEVSGEDHDRAMATVQAAVHAAVLSFAAALDELDHDVAGLWDLATPPYRTMLALAARVAGGDAHVYHDVQAANPHAADARRALGAGLARVCDATATPDRFGELLASVVDRLGDRHEELAATCAEMFRTAAR